MRPGLLLPLLSLLLAAPAAALPDLSPDALLREELFREAAALPRGRRPTTGLVLSAGSLRATAHVGVLTVLENNGFPVDVVAGTSMGAIVGALYSSGKSIPWLWEMAYGLKVDSGSNLNTFTLLRYVLADKLLSSENTERFLKQELGDRRFEQLPRPFACVAMDLHSGEAIIFREGPVAPAVRASMNLPGIFEPVEYRHRYLVDGGVVDYVPVDAAKLLGAQWILASITEPDFSRTKPSNVVQSLERVIDIRGSLLSRQQRRAADFILEPPVGDIGFTETERVDDALSAGVTEAYRALPKAQESFILATMPSLMTDFLPGPANGRRTK